jgi:hypothetical protein
VKHPFAERDEPVSRLFPALPPSTESTKLRGNGVKLGAVLIALADLACAPAVGSRTTPRTHEPYELVQSYRQGCILWKSGRVQCWLVPERYRERSVATELVTVRDLPPLVQLGIADYGTACGRTSGGDIWCWDVDSRRGTRTVGAILRKIDIPPAKKLVVGSYTACALLWDRRISCWDVVELPTGYARVDPEGDVVDALYAGSILCLRRLDGRTRCGGRWDRNPSILPPVVNELSGNAFGVCFRGRSRFVSCTEGTFTALLGELPIAASRISVGGTHACAQTSDGLLYCWGQNDYGAADPRGRWRGIALPRQIGSIDPS